MMNCNTILIGKCEGSIMDAHVAIEKYAIMEQGAFRFAVLDVTNHFDRPLTEFEVEIEQYDAGGNSIHVRKEIRKGLCVAPDATLVIEEVFALDPRCEEARFTILCATHGSYRYTAVGRQICAEYTATPKPTCSEEELCKKTDGSFSHVESRLRFTPKQIAISAFAILLLAFCSFLLYLEAFSANQNEFLLSNVIYRYTDKEKTTVAVVGTRGYGKNIVINDSIDQIKVTEICEKAFYRANYLTALEVNGDIKIGRAAFSECPELQSVSLSGNITIGSHAFAKCRNLSDLQTSGVRSLGESSFEDCERLQTIVLNNSESISVGTRAFAACSALTSFTCDADLVIDPNHKDIFASSCALRELSLASFLLGETGQDRIKVLFGNAEYIALETLTIQKIERIPDAFCEGLSSLKTVRFSNIQDPAIGNYAFYNCKMLSTFESPVAISSIGAFAFGGTALTHFNATGLLSIGESCFRDAAALVSFSFPETITVIPQDAFRNCISLQTVSFPSKCRTIHENAFSGCTALRSAILSSKDLQTIEFGVFTGCTSLEEMRVPFLGRSIDEPDTLSYFFGNNYPPASLKKVSVRDGAPCAQAFARAKYLEEVIFEGSFSLLRYSTFAGCDSLRRVTLPGDLQEIEADAFSGCDNLRSITLPANIFLIGNGAFDGCSRLYEVLNRSRNFTIERGTEAAGGVAKNALVVANPNEEDPRHVFLSDCDFMEADGIWYLIDYAGDQSNAVFPGGQDLSRSGVLSYRIPAYCFKGFQFVDLAINDGLSEIAGRAFLSCADLARISLPSTLYKIGNNAFFGCYTLKEIGFGAASVLSSIGSNAFAECSALEAIVLPDSLLDLGSYAFAQNTMLKSVRLGASLTGVSEAAFAGCKALERVTFGLNIGEIKRKAFSGCSSLRAVDLSNSVGCTQISEFAFENCESLTTVTLNNAVTYIGTAAFKNASSLTTLVMSSSLEALSEEAFFNCSQLTAVSLPQALQSIGPRAFSDCSSLQKVSFNDTILATDLSSECFRNCFALESVRLPQGIETIGESAFANCSSLELLYLPQSITAIRTNAFFGCMRLYEIFNYSTLSLSCGSTNMHGGVAARAYLIHDKDEAPMAKCKTKDMTLICPLGNWLLVEYRSNENYENVTLGTVSDGVTSVPTYTVSARAFENCLSLKSITFTAAVSAIEANTFVDLLYLQTVTFTPDCPVTEIPATAFANCKNLGVLTLPQSLQRINTGAFSGCTSLLSVTLYENLRAIGSGAFSNCTSLYEVYDLTPYLDIRAGATDNGLVGYNALIVHTSASAPRLEMLKTSESGRTCTFLKILNEWYLFSFRSTNSIARLPESVSQGGTVHSATYRIHEKLIPSLTAYSAMMIPNTITATPGNFLNSLHSLKAVYFHGTQSEWTAFCGIAGSTSASVYYYTNCVHSEGTWMYTAHGSISTTPSRYNLISTTPGTCTTRAQNVYSCPLCGDTKTEEGAFGDHALSGNGVCIHCNQTIAPPPTAPENNTENGGNNTAP